MKFIFTLLFFLSFAGIVQAQEKRFIFIQSENRQPFYVLLNNKIFSSTASGYVIIPQVKDGDYNFSIGFAKNEFPEQPFKIPVNKNVGLSLKNFGEKGWGLFNIQSLAVTMAGEVKQIDVAKDLPVQKEETPISFDVKPAPVLAKVAQDGETSQQVDDTSATVNEGSAKLPAILPEEQPQAQLATINSPVEVRQKRVKKGKATNKEVQKVSENNTSDGVALTYTDGTGIKTDTINIVIPPPVAEEIKNVDAKISSANTEKEKVTKSDNIDSTSSNKAIRFLGIEGEKQSIEKNYPPLSTSGACTLLANEDDYTKLRKKMARETSDEDMLKEAKKFYSIKCFSTLQVKNLSTLFLSDEGRLLFFQNSYEFVSDPENFTVLNKEFIDPVIVNRFNLLFTK